MHCFFGNGQATRAAIHLLEVNFLTIFEINPSASECVTMCAQMVANKAFPPANVTFLPFVTVHL